MLTARATLLDADGKPLAGRTVDLCAFGERGEAISLATAKTGARGEATLASDRAFGGFAPRVCLRIVEGGRPLRLTELPVSFAGGAIDFGTVVCARDALFDVGGTAYHGFPAGALAKLRGEPGRAAPAAAAPPPAGGAAQVAAQVAALQQSVAALTAAKAAAEKRLVETEARRAADLGDRDGAHRAAVTAKDGEIARLREQLDRREVEDGAATSVEHLIQDTGEQIERAHAALRARPGGVRLGRVSMQLRLIPGKTGRGVSFLGKDDLAKVAGEALSAMELEFGPAAEPAARTPAGGVVVPRVLGYTELMARRKLEEAGLACETRLETAPAGAGTGGGAAGGEGGRSLVGRVLRQQPGAGVEVASGTVVTIAIGIRS